MRVWDSLNHLCPSGLHWKEFSGRQRRDLLQPQHKKYQEGARQKYAAADMIAPTISPFVPNSRMDNAPMKELNENTGPVMPVLRRTR